MPTERISRAQRLRLKTVAEREIMRYAGDHANWHKHVHNVDLDPMQVLKMVEMDRNPNTVDFSCRRTGKTTTKELWLLEYLATNPDQELGIVAPREKQALVNLNYHLDAIRRSPILNAYIAHKSGRPQLADTYYEFANRSKAQAYGIMAQVDGGDLTVASLEEVDDMPRERLYNRFLLMMGAARKLGASRDSRNDPQIRITGVYKGADTLAEMVASGNYHVLPTMDVHLGIKLGILNEAFMTLMRSELSSEEYIRQLLCRNVSSKNFIWESYVREAMRIWVAARLTIADPLPGATYRKRGLLSFGYDAGGHGENPASSKHCLVVAEQIGNWITFPFVKTWAPTADDNVVKRDLLSLWRYFQPDYALGDAYAVGMLTDLNDDLFKEGLTSVDRRAIGDGESSASTWPGWPFSPIRFEGQVKHNMASSLKAAFHHGHAALPNVDDEIRIEGRGDNVYEFPSALIRDLALFAKQLTNVVTAKSGAAYPRYVMKSRKIGDDGFDAGMASVWALITRGQADTPSAVLSSVRSREQILLPRAAMA